MQPRPLRVLIVMPSWVGDVVMATPALRLVRTRLKGAFIGALLRPGLDDILAGSGLVDEFHVDRARGVMGPKLVAARVRPRRYESALLLTNSFSTALIARLAFIPDRVGYDRDGRGLLLTRALKPAMRDDAGVLAAMGIGRSGYAVQSAVDAYLHAARAFLDDAAADQEDPAPALELGLTDAQESAALGVLRCASIAPGERYALVNPGANDAAKRWPPERFAAVGAWLARERGLRVLVNGSPGEREVVQSVMQAMAALGIGAQRAASLVDCGVTLGSLKGVIRGCSLVVTNDTGPRHIAAAFGVPTVTLFGPTDPRWTTLPPPRALVGGPPMWEDVVADPTLPADWTADEHPARCAIDRVATETVIAACERLLRAATAD